MKEKIGAKTKLLAGVLFLALIVVVVKWMFFPSVKNAYFAMDARSLRQAPSGLVVIRPTHFAFLRSGGILRVPPPRHGDHGQWMMGRDASLREVIAAAYGQDPSRVLMPPDAPGGHFDFIVTTADKQREHLQSVIQKKLGYIAQKERRNIDVMALKVKNAGIPGLAVSGAHEKPHFDYFDVRVQFTHVPVVVLAHILDQMLETPVVNETGLTNFYNFTIPWNPRKKQQILNQGNEIAAGNKMLAGLGLGLEPTKTSLKMLVVKPAK